MNARRWLAFVLALGFVLGLVGCSAGTGPFGDASARRPPMSPVAEGEAVMLLPVESLPEDLLLRQRVTIRWPGGEESFGAVLQKRGSELLLLGLGPMSSLGFRLSLDATGVHFENRTGRELPFEPERILADVQRVFYPWFELPADCRDCRRKAMRLGFEIIERFGPEQLAERRFTRLDSADAQAITVHYEGWWPEPRVPGRATLRNAAAGYELVIETSEAERLDGPLDAPRE